MIRIESNEDTSQELDKPKKVLDRVFLAMALGSILLLGIAIGMFVNEYIKSDAFIFGSAEPGDHRVTEWPRGTFVVERFEKEYAGWNPVAEFSSWERATELISAHGN